MSKNARCYTCGGSGLDRRLEMGEEPCDNCAGIGRDTKSDLWAEPCRKCNGRRTVPYCRKGPSRQCIACRGTGFVPY